MLSYKMNTQNASQNSRGAIGYVNNNGKTSRSKIKKPCTIFHTIQYDFLEIKEYDYTKVMYTNSRNTGAKCGI